MAGTRSSNTMTEQLRSLLGQLAEMKAAPDADIAYLTNLETQVLQFLRAPFEKQRLEAQLGGQGAAAAGATGPPGAATPVGPTAELLFGPPTPGPVGPGLHAGPRVPGVKTAPTMPNGDELRRLFEQPAL